MSRRSEQVAALMQQELGGLMLVMELPAMTTISRVEVTPDLKHAKVWISVLTESPAVEKQVLEALRADVYDMQGKINRTLTMHHAPRISFHVDGTQHYASRINELLRKTHEDQE